MASFAGLLRPKPRNLLLPKRSATHEHTPPMALWFIDFFAVAGPSSAAPTRRAAPPLLPAHQWQKRRKQPPWDCLPMPLIDKARRCLNGPCFCRPCGYFCLCGSPPRGRWLAGRVPRPSPTGVGSYKNAIPCMLFKTSQVRINRHWTGLSNPL